MNRITLSVIGMILFIASCGPTMKSVRTVWYEPDPSTPMTQTINDVTISIEPVSQKNYSKFSELGVRRSSLPEYVIDPVTGGKIPIQSSFKAITYEKEGIIWTLTTGDGFTGYYAKIKNNTDHILRMGDARIYYIVSGETFPAIPKAEYGQAEPDVLGREIGKAAAKQMKFVNDLSTEILPGFEFGGHMVFAIDPSKAEKGELKFFDITTKVDKTGAPLEKTSFSFKLVRKEETKTYKVGWNKVEEVK